MLKIYSEAHVSDRSKGRENDIVDDYEDEALMTNSATI